MNRESISVARPASLAVGRGVAIRILLAAGAICLAFSTLLEARDKKTKGGVEADDADITKPQLLGAESNNPILRYPAASFSGWSIFSTSYGWFDVSRDGGAAHELRHLAEMINNRHGDRCRITYLKK